MGFLGGDATVNNNIEGPIQILDGEKGIILCSKCRGAGKDTEYRSTYGEGPRICPFCEGSGCLQIDLEHPKQVSKKDESK